MDDADHRPFVIRRPADLPGIEVVTGRAEQLPPVRHMHENFRIGLTTVGTLRTRYESRHFDITPGTVQLAQPGANSICDMGTTAQAFMTVDLAPQVLKSLTSGSGIRVGFREHVTRDPRIARLVTGFVHAVERQEALLDRSSRLELLIEGILDNAHLSRRPIRGVRSPAVTRAKELIDDQPDADIALTDLAKLVGMSPFHFTRVFRDQIGLPPHAYQLHRRVEVAKRALAHHGTSLTQIATGLGFYDQSHLVRHFRTRVGMTPAAYRQALAA